MSTIKVSIIDECGIESKVSFPAKKEVCPECDGEGYVLREGLRGHAFSREEFEETFCEDEDREAYFTRGGKYDQFCPCCKGKNVVDVPDPSQMNSEEKKLFQEWEKDQNKIAREREYDHRTMRAESGCWD